MKRWFDIDSITALKNPAVTIGSFDGVHQGHKQLLARLRTIAQEQGGETLVITFDPHPRQVLKPNVPTRLITTTEEKLALLEAEGIDHTLVIPFDRAFSKITAQEFVEHILLEKLHTQTLMVGFNHHLGNKQQGDTTTLREYSARYGFRLEEVSAQEIDQQTVSSTRIREALAVGDLRTASHYLGHPYTLTAELHADALTGIPDAKILPPKGSYSVVYTPLENTLHKAPISDSLTIYSAGTLSLEHTKGEVVVEKVVVKFL